MPAQSSMLRTRGTLSTIIHPWALAPANQWLEPWILTWIHAIFLAREGGTQRRLSVLCSGTQKSEWVFSFVRKLDEVKKSSRKKYVKNSKMSRNQKESGTLLLFGKDSQLLKHWVLCWQKKVVREAIVTEEGKKIAITLPRVLILSRSFSVGPVRRSCAMRRTRLVNQGDPISKESNFLCLFFILFYMDFWFCLFWYGKRWL